MFVVNDDLSIYVTRGDIVCLNVSAVDDKTGGAYEFQPGDIVRMKIFGKKDAENVVMQKDFPVVAKTDTVGVLLTEKDTKFGDVISKPTDYWYEIELNPFTNPQTIVGYDEDGAKIFKLFPEGKDITTDEPTKPEDVPVVDKDLSLLSSRPVENKAIARAVTLLRNDVDAVNQRLTAKISEVKGANRDTVKELEVERARIDSLVASPTPGDSELVDIRVGADGVTYGSAGAAVRGQIKEVAERTERNRIAIEGGEFSENILYDAEWESGYVNAQYGITGAGNNGEAHTNMLAVVPNTEYQIRYVRNHTGNFGWVSLAEYDADGNALNRVAYDENAGEFGEATTEDGKTVFYFTITTLADTYCLQLSGRTWLFASDATDDEVAQALVSAKRLFAMHGNVTYPARVLPNVSEKDEGAMLVVNDGAWRIKSAATNYASINPNVKSINHRGYNTVAPENTLSAYRLSKKKGFDIVEADVSFTADGVAVLLHDTTVDRTSNGTGAISKLTFDYVRSLDFGSWKSADYAGEQIPTFEEFIALCRKIGLHPYIELKDPVTRAQIDELVSTVKLYGMADKVTWITASGSTYLAYVKNAHNSARLGLVVTAVQESHINEMVALKDTNNEVFINAVSEQLTDEMIALCAENDIPLEVWDLWSAEQIVSAHSYISGFTTDAIIAGVELYKTEL